MKRLGDRSDHYDRSAISNKFVRHSVSLGRAPWRGAQAEGATYVARTVCSLFFMCVLGKVSRPLKRVTCAIRLVVHKIEMNLLHDAASSSSLVVCRLSLCFGFVN